MRVNKLHLGARISLFIVSYLPLFFIMCFVQLYTYSDYLNWKGISVESVTVFLKYFGAVSFLIVLSLFGIFGLIPGEEQYGVGMDRGRFNSQYQSLLERLSSLAEGAFDED